MTTLAGELAIVLDWDGRRVTDVDIASSRPTGVDRVLLGQPPGAAVALVPRLYSLCGCAQGAVAAGAMDAAQGTATAGSLDAARRLAIALEMMQEHVWRLGFDWAEAMDEAPAIAMVRETRAAIATVLAPLMRCVLAEEGAVTPPRGEIDAVIGAVARHAEAGLLGTPPRAWLEQDSLADLQRWSAAGRVAPARWLARLAVERDARASNAVVLMPAWSGEALLHELTSGLATAFGGGASPGLPLWHGAPAETGALARQQHHPLVAAMLADEGPSVGARLVARLTELAGLLDDPDTCASPARLGSGDGHRGEGFAAAHTARGLLTHRVRLEAGRVAAFDILAPTDWNFHPQGAFAVAAGGITAVDAAGVHRQALRIARAIDPCVACRIEVRRA